jgi:hypothetical protein
MYNTTYEVQLLHEVQLHIGGTAAPTRHSCTYEAQLHLRYSSTCEVQLHLQGTAEPSMYSCTYEAQLHHEVQLHLRGTAAPTRHNCTYKAAAHTRYSTATSAR